MSEPIRFPAVGISDGEITLRLLAEADLPALIELCQDPEIPRRTRVPSPYGEAEAAEWFERQARGREAGEILNLMIVDGEDRLLGSVGIVEVDWEEGRCELATCSRGRLGAAAS